MAKAGRIYHWKHGWIPLDSVAMAKIGKRKGLPLTVDEKRAELNKRRATRGEAPLLPRKSTAKKAGPTVTFEAIKPKRTRKPPSDAEKIAPTKEARAKAAEEQFRRFAGGLVADQAEANAAAQARRIKQARTAYRKVDTVDGVEFVSYKSASMDPLGDDHGQPWEMDEAQKQVVADAYNEVKAEFPGMQPVQIVATQGKEGILGITTWDGRRISMSKNAFTDEQRALAHRNFGDHGALAGQYTYDPEAFARAVVVHEMGHALEMQKAEARRRGDEIALERITRAEVGQPPSVMELVNDRPEKTPRWMIDTLNEQTVYGLGNQFEWFAEAFADGWFNGDKASPSGKRALAILKDIYGKKAAA